MAVGFRGSSSLGGSTGIDFDSDYFDIPVTPLNKIVPRTDYSAPVTGGNEVALGSTFDSAAFNQSYDVPVIDPAMYGSSIMDRSEGPPMLSEPDYFTKGKVLTEQDIQNYLNDTEGFVYNPSTNNFEGAGDYTYPLSKIAPGYSDTQEKLMLGIKPGVTTGDQLRDIELNRLNTQKLAFEVPMGEGVDMFDNYNEAYTGFDSSGNFTGAPLDLGTQAMNDIPDYSQPTQSVFDEGGAFGGKQ